MVFNNTIKHNNNTMNTLTEQLEVTEQTFDKAYIIGLAGKSKSGKTTLAKCIQSIFPIASIYSFATPVKECTQLLTKYFKLTIPERALNQIIGTEIGRGILSKWMRENLWISIMNMRIILSKSPIIIIDDVRFDDEADFIQSQGGYVFMLDRVENKEGMIHESEEIDIKHYTKCFKVDHNVKYSDIAKYITAEYLI